MLCFFTSVSSFKRERLCRLDVVSNVECKMSSEEGSSPPEKKRQLSCATCFDALWFCYSPVHQMKNYYQLGVMDNCTGKWGALFDCLVLKTKRSSEIEKILEDREKAKAHIWTFRTVDEASSNWKEQFGHLDDMNFD